MVIAKWQGELDEERFKAVLADPSLADPDVVPEAAETEQVVPVPAERPVPVVRPERVPALT
jgi:aerobic C4-dicarboxylate transport protein